MKKRIDTEKRVYRLRQILHEARQRIIADIEKQLGQELDPSIIRKIDTAVDVGDLASLDLGESVDYTVLEMRYKTYKDIADAFRRLEAGTYGICEKCGAEIPVERLKANPFARFCVPCQTGIEELEKVERKEV